MKKHDGNYMRRENDRISFCKNQKQWHKSAKTANARCAEIMIKRASLREMTKCWLECMMTSTMNHVDTRLPLG